MARGKPTNPQTVERFRVALMAGRSLSQAAQLCGLSKSTAAGLRARILAAGLDALEPARAAAAAEAIAEAGPWLADRLKRLADELYALAATAAQKVRYAISEPDELPAKLQAQVGSLIASHDRDGAAWVRALVGVLSQAVEKAQLLAGKPTERGALTFEEILEELDGGAAHESGSDACPDHSPRGPGASESDELH